MVNSLNPSKNPGSGVINPALPTIGSSITPEIASGFSESAGTYAREKADLGGIWEGKTAVVIYGTGDAEIVNLDLSGKAMKDMGGRNIDLFDYQGKVDMVNPQRGN